ncbi:LacI family DNA-binding transcriptional regulator [uncultured Amnibacterium sp.]|uniref:LacI family DNA-binding transcriptional regulator n=1 Tax=uncultured Amnibacterium sp. TaxID=1631851 RepID=UPI0035CAFED7
MAVGSRPARPASIRDVARLAGVSHQTVSRVLNDSPSIHEATRNRVVAAMAELQYRPSAAARALSTNRSKTIGVLAATRAHYGPSRAIEAIEEAARSRGYFVTSASMGRTDEESVRAALVDLLAQDVEALVVVAPALHVAETIATLAPGVPYVLLRSAGAGDETGLRVDEIAGARLATRHLLDLGHTAIVHVAGPHDWIEAQARQQGFEDELASHGLSALRCVQGDWTADAGHRAGLELLPDRQATAVFCSNDSTAIGLLHAAHELGVAVPGDLSVVGYDDIPEAAHLWPPLTTVRQDFAALGLRCVTTLLGEEDAPAALVPQLVLRATTAPPREEHR